MAEPLSDRVIRKIDEAADLYHRLVMLVAPAGAGKTAAFQDVHESTDAPLLNVNLELSRRMLEFTERQRALQLPRLMSEMVNAAPADVITATAIRARETMVFLMAASIARHASRRRQSPITVASPMCLNR